MKADTCSDYTNFDTVISIFDTPCDIDANDNINATCLVSNDYSCGSLTSSVIWQTEPGVEYYIRVSAFSDGHVGKFALRLSTLELPANHVCSDAIELTVGEDTLSGDEIGGFGSTANMTTTYVSDQAIDTTNSTLPMCESDTSTTGLWYSLQGTGQGIQLSTCHNDTNVDTGINVYSGDCDVMECVASASADDNHGCSGYGTRTVIRTEAGVEYLIFVDTRGEEDFVLTASPFYLAPNDECTDALSIVPDSGAIIMGSTAEASPSYTEACLSQGRSDLWYRVEGTGDVLVASTCGDDTTSDTIIEVMEAAGESCHSLSCVASNDDACGVGSRVEWLASVGTTYFVRVAAYSGTTVGDFQMTVTTAP